MSELTNSVGTNEFDKEPDNSDLGDGIRQSNPQHTIFHHPSDKANQFEKFIFTPRFFNPQDSVESLNELKTPSETEIPNLESRYYSEDPISSSDDYHIINEELRNNLSYSITDQSNLESNSSSNNLTDSGEISNVTDHSSNDIVDSAQMKIITKSIASIFQMLGKIAKNCESSPIKTFPIMTMKEVKHINNRLRHLELNLDTIKRCISGILVEMDNPDLENYVNDSVDNSKEKSIAGNTLNDRVIDAEIDALINPYDEYYYESRQRMMNLLCYKKSQRTIDLNDTPMLDYGIPDPLEISDEEDTTMLSRRIKDPTFIRTLSRTQNTIAV